MANLLTYQRFRVLIAFQRLLSSNLSSRLTCRQISTALVNNAEDKVTKTDETFQKSETEMKSDQWREASQNPENTNKDTHPSGSDVVSFQGGEVVDPKAIEKPKFRGVFQRMRESHEKLVRESGGPVKVTTNLDKVSLLWAKKYATPEEIPQLISKDALVMPDDKMRVVLLFWIMSTVTFFFLTMIYLGQRRRKWCHDQITERQKQIWADRARAGTSQAADIST